MAGDESSSTGKEVFTLQNKVKKLEGELYLAHINQLKVMKHLEIALELVRNWIGSSKWGSSSSRSILRLGSCSPGTRPKWGSSSSRSRPK